MPAKPSYSHQLAAGLEVLAAHPEDWVDRRQVEEVLGVSKTVAWRILHQCGAKPGPGNTLICKRTELIAKLQQMQEGGTVHEKEIARRTRLERLLENVRPTVIANLTQVARDEKALRLLSSTFRKLPPNVKLTPTSLHVDFQGPENFLESVGALVYALHNDYEEIRTFLEQSSS